MWGDIATKWYDALALIFNEGEDVESTIEGLVEEANEILADSL